jgi:hypothetical protein
MAMRLSVLRTDRALFPRNIFFCFWYWSRVLHCPWEPCNCIYQYIILMLLLKAWISILKCSNHLNPEASNSAYKNILGIQHMLRVGFEPMTAAFKRPKTVHSLYRAATVIDAYNNAFSKNSNSLGTSSLLGPFWKETYIPRNTNENWTCSKCVADKPVSVLCCLIVGDVDLASAKQAILGESTLRSTNSVWCKVCLRNQNYANLHTQKATKYEWVQQSFVRNNVSTKDCCIHSLLHARQDALTTKCVGMKRRFCISNRTPRTEIARTEHVCFW